MKTIIGILLLLILFAGAVILYCILQIIPDEYDKDIDIIDYDGTPDDEEDKIDE